MKPKLSGGIFLRSKDQRSERTQFDRQKNDQDTTCDRLYSKVKTIFE